MNDQPKPTPTQLEQDLASISARRNTTGSTIRSLTTLESRVVHTGDGNVSELDSSGKFGATRKGPALATPSNLSTRAKSSGVELAKRLNGMDTSDLRRERTFLDSLTDDVRTIDGRDVWDAHDKRMDKHLSGNAKSTPAIYRGFLDAQDELLSSSPSASFMEGLRSVPAPKGADDDWKTERNQTMRSMVRFRSSFRSPTEHTKAHITPDGSSKVLGSDHPTSKELDETTEDASRGRSAHNAADRSRAAKSLSAFEDAFKHTKGVAVPMMTSALAATVEHATVMSLPGRSTSSPLKAPDPFLDSQIESREKVKRWSVAMEKKLDPSSQPRGRQKKTAPLGLHSRATSPEREDSPPPSPSRKRRDTSPLSVPTPSRPSPSSTTNTSALPGDLSPVQKRARMMSPVQQTPVQQAPVHQAPVQHTPVQTTQLRRSARSRRGSNKP